MSQDALDVARFGYALLAIACSLGFTLTLALRWDALARSERIIRAGLIVEHVVLTYGGYVALTSPHVPVSLVAPLLCGSMLVILLGLSDFLVNDLLPHYRRAARSGG